MENRAWCHGGGSDAGDAAIRSGKVDVAAALCVAEVVAFISEVLLIGEVVAAVGPVEPSKPLASDDTL